MLDLLRPGTLEVQTDLLLGVEEVLLPNGFARPAQAHASSAPSVISTPRGFESALFESKAGAVGVAQATAPQRRASTESPSLVQPPALGARSGAAWASVSSSPAPTNAPITPIADRIVPPVAPSKGEQLELLEALHARECPHCTTATAHKRLVFGEGNPDAELVFIGEAPGETEDELGRPFVGRAGEKLNEMISAMGFSRDEVYIANVLKSRPPDNRTPLAHEIDRCGPFLLAQLAIISPKAIVTLGGPASKLLLASELGITRLRGVMATVRIGAASGAPLDVPVMPTFHPAYLLRNYTPETRSQVWEDLKKVLAVLGRGVPQRK